MKVVQPFYRKRKWLKKRNRILKRDNYECQLSKRYGKSIDAEVVHHIYPLEDYPGIAYEDWNLISLSNTMHNKVHDRKNNKIIGEGKNLQKKFEKEFHQHYPPTINSYR